MGHTRLRTSGKAIYLSTEAMVEWNRRQGFSGSHLGCGSCDVSEHLGEKVGSERPTTGIIGRPARHT